MHNIAFADEIHAFLDDEANVEALTDAVQDLQRIFRDGTFDRPHHGILPIENLQAMSQEDHRRIHSQCNPNPFCYSRTDYLDARIAVLRCSNAPLPDYNAFVKIIPTEE